MTELILLVCGMVVLYRSRIESTTSLDASHAYDWAETLACFFLGTCFAVTAFVMGADAWHVLLNRRAQSLRKAHDVELSASLFDLGLFSGLLSSWLEQASSDDISMFKVVEMMLLEERFCGRLANSPEIDENVAWYRSQAKTTPTILDSLLGLVDSPTTARSPVALCTPATAAAAPAPTDEATTTSDSSTTGVAAEKTPPLLRQPSAHSPSTHLGALCSYASMFGPPYHVAQMPALFVFNKAIIGGLLLWVSRRGSGGRIVVCHPLQLPPLPLPPPPPPPPPSPPPLPLFPADHGRSVRRRVSSSVRPSHPSSLWYSGSRRTITSKPPHSCAGGGAPPLLDPGVADYT